ncbi:MAG: hypothetical protein J6P44_02685 [Bacteroidales bacterium]|nr:hypothetical protein [Bacteroidales bacterium]
MKTLKFLITAVIAGVALTSFYGCSDDKDDSSNDVSVIGLWKYEQASDKTTHYYQFGENNGVYTKQAKNGYGYQHGFTYTISGKTVSLIIESNELPENVVWDITEISSSEIKATTNGSTITLQKADEVPSYKQAKNCVCVVTLEDNSMTVNLDEWLGECEDIEADDLGRRQFEEAVVRCHEE